MKKISIILIFFTTQGVKVDYEQVRLLLLEFYIAI